MQIIIKKYYILSIRCCKAIIGYLCIAKKDHFESYDQFLVDKYVCNIELAKKEIGFCYFITIYIEFLIQFGLGFFK